MAAKISQPLMAKKRSVPGWPGLILLAYAMAAKPQMAFPSVSSVGRMAIFFMVHSILVQSSKVKSSKLAVERILYLSCCIGWGSHTAKMWSIGSRGGHGEKERMGTIH